MKGVYDRRRPWEGHPRLLLHLRLSQEVPRKNKDGAVAVSASASVTVIEAVIETTIAKVVVVAAVVVIASVDAPETKDMVKEDEEECGWAVRASGLDGECKSIAPTFI